MNEQRAREIVGQRAGGRCELAIEGVCHGMHQSIHHRLKRSHGGAWAPSNLLAACGDGTRGCHGYVEANPAWARDMGLWIFTGDGDPAEISVYMRWMGFMSWYTLDDEGILTWDGGSFDPVPRGASLF